MEFTEGNNHKERKKPDFNRGFKRSGQGRGKSTDISRRRKEKKDKTGKKKRFADSDTQMKISVPKFLSDSVEKGANLGSKKASQLDHTEDVLEDTDEIEVLKYIVEFCDEICDFDDFM